MDWIDIDGSEGEGGGQLLRTGLSLAMLLKRPLRMRRIRAGRAKPGLMRQHLAAVRAAQQCCAAEIQGDHLGSTSLEFHPRDTVGSDYRIDIGSAGSTTLVLQTLLPALLRASEPSRITLCGGTHNMLAPSVSFLQRSFVPQLASLGADLSIELKRHGLFPAGGGELTATIMPRPLRSLDLMERGGSGQVGAEALLASVPTHVGIRELGVLRAHYELAEDALSLRDLGGTTGPGNVLSVWIAYPNVTELITCHGERGVSAEQVAREACRLLDDYIASPAVVGTHLADQLLLPWMLAGGGRYLCGAPSSHLLTNAALISRITGLEIRLHASKEATEIVAPGLR